MAITTKEQLLKVLRAFFDRYDQSCKRLISAAAFSCYTVVFNKMQSLPLIFGGRLFLCALCYNRMSFLIEKTERRLFFVNVQA